MKNFFCFATLHWLLVIYNTAILAHKLYDAGDFLRIYASEIQTKN